MGTHQPKDVAPAAAFFADVSSQADFDLQFYQQILARNGYHLDALRQLVERLAQRGEHAAALELDRRLVAIMPEDMIARYNLACTLCMLGQVDSALSALDRAFQLGYRDLAHLEVDSDLDPLRQHAGFQRLLVKYGLA